MLSRLTAITVTINMVATPYNYDVDTAHLALASGGSSTGLISLDPKTGSMMIPSDRNSGGPILYGSWHTYFGFITFYTAAAEAQYGEEEFLVDCDTQGELICTGNKTKGHLYPRSGFVSWNPSDKASTDDTFVAAYPANQVHVL